jgi:hypothetical protein
MGWLLSFVGEERERRRRTRIPSRRKYEVGPDEPAT